MIRLYSYAGCGTCRKALKFLADHNVHATIFPIREQPPSKTELRRMLELVGGNVRRLFNTSGQDYKRLKLKDRLPGLGPDDAIDLLSRHGNLIKRPFVLTDSGGTVGFDPAEWKKLLR